MLVEATDYPKIDCAVLTAGKSYLLYFTRCEQTGQPRVQLRSVVALDETHAVTADITGGPRRRISRGTLETDKRYRLYVAPCSGARKVAESAAPHLDIPPPTPVLSDAVAEPVVAAPQPEKAIRVEPTAPRDAQVTQTELWDSMFQRSFDRVLAAGFPELEARIQATVRAEIAASRGEAGQ